LKYEKYNIINKNKY